MPPHSRVATVSYDLEFVNQMHLDQLTPTPGITTGDSADAASEMRTPEIPHIGDRVGSRTDDGCRPWIVGSRGSNEVLPDGS